MMPSKKKLKKIFETLNNLYGKIPPTQGCMEHINKPKEEGGCGGWCCFYQQPSLLTVEFINTWRTVLKEWSLDDIIDLIEAATALYLSDLPTKGCLFWDKETKLCRQHKSRPLSCRQYGITPEEEFKPRYERLKVLYQHDLAAVIKDQCDLVSTKDGRKVTTEHTTKWWNELMEIEKSIGVDPEDINEEPGGTYRTYPEHILMHILSADNIRSLENIRKYGNQIEKAMAVEQFIKNVRDNVERLVAAQKGVQYS